MCVAFWALDHPEYALVLCTNRDEYLSRPTMQAHFHTIGRGPDGSQQASFILSGRDLQAGGTWLGINRTGRVAVLTNVTEKAGLYKQSRGHLVSSFLMPGAPELEQFVHEYTSEMPAEFAGFNLLLFSPSTNAEETLSYKASLMTNSGGGGAISVRPFQEEENRIGGLSNGVDSLDGREWPKVQKGRNSLSQLLSLNAVALSEDDLVTRLFELLSWQCAEAPGNRSQLRNTIEVPPLRMTASLAADAAADGLGFYGTRLSTILLVRKDGQVSFVERDIWQLDNEGRVVRGDPRDERVFRFSLNKELPVDAI